MFTEKIFGSSTTTNSARLAVPVDRQIADSGLMVDAVMHSANAIGYVSSPMIGDAKTLAISDGSGAAIRPSELSIVTEDYPICRRLILYDWDAPGSLMNAFVRYVVYKPGQMLVTQTPFVNLTPKIFPVVPAQNAPIAYKEIASKYSRIGLSFHLLNDQIDSAGDTSQLDNLARVNVLRLRTFLSQHNSNGNDLLLLGFGDPDEGGIRGRHLALTRAETVAASLREIGVIVPSENIRAFGSEFPVATNNTPEGRHRNRRVEVWVRNRLAEQP
jgi:phosphate transport system substrate-binding protein